MTVRFEHSVALTGIGRSIIDRQPPPDASAQALEATQTAINDAGLEPADIDGVCGVPGATGLPGISAGGFRELEQSLGLRPTWHCAGRESAGPAGAVVDAMLAVASGLCRHVLCFAVTSATRDVRGTGDEELSPAARAALAASEYLARYGADRESLGWVAIAARRHAERNPDALCREPIDMAGYLSAASVSSPLGVLDCGVASDGAVALVISAADRAEDGRHRPVWVDAVGTRHTPDPGRRVGLASHERVLGEPAAHLWSRATITRQDVDFLTVDDTFTLDTLCWLEALGFCGPGEAPQFVAGARRIGPDGVLPVNPHGGQLSGGHGGAYDNLYETVLQLRGGAEVRQIPSARVGLACGGDGHAANAMLLHTGA